MDRNSYARYAHIYHCVLQLNVQSLNACSSLKSETVASAFDPRLMSFGAVRVPARVRSSVLLLGIRSLDLLPAAPVLG